jgi:hypothetical protein
MNTWCGSVIVTRFGASCFGADIALLTIITFYKSTKPSSGGSYLYHWSPNALRQVFHSARILYSIL